MSCQTLDANITPTSPSPTSHKPPLIRMHVPRGPCKQTRRRVKDIVQHVPLRISPQIARRLNAREKKRKEPIGCRRAARNPGRLVISISICNAIFFLWLRACTKRLFSTAAASLLPTPPTPPRMQTNSPFPFHEAFVALQRNFGPQTSRNGTSQQK